MTSKQRAYLKSLAANRESLYQIGKGGITPKVIQTLDEALTARELIKVTLHETSPEEPGKTGKTLAEALTCEIVQIIGRKAVLYRKNGEHPKIVLPGE